MTSSSSSSPSDPAFNRIELEEIEVAIYEQPKVARAVVVVQDAIRPETAR